MQKLLLSYRAPQKLLPRDDLPNRSKIYLKLKRRYFDWFSDKLGWSCAHHSKSMSKVDHCKCGKPHKATHVIFDLDGTLLNSEVHYSRALRETCQSYGKNFTHEDHIKILGCSSEMGARILIDSMDIKATTGEFLDKYHDVAHKLIGDSELMPGAEKLIKHLHKHKIPMAIATSSIAQGFDLKMKRHQAFLKMFHHYVLTVDPEVKNGKPSPDIFLVACKRFPGNPRPEDCLVFEDAPNGLKAAKAAKMQCVLMPDKNVPDELMKGANLVIRSLHEFKPELFGLPPMDK